MTEDPVRSLKDRLYRIFTLGASNKVNGVFYFLFASGIILSIIAYFVTHGNSLNNMLILERWEYAMDYFNSIYFSSLDPYSPIFKSIYPALTTLGYYVLGVILEAIDGPFDISYDIRASTSGMASYILMVLLAMLILYWALHKSKEVSRKETVVFYLLALVSFPMLFTIDRGNSVLFAVLFSLLFLVGYNSENKKVRYLSYVFLGIATAIKIYPLLFGLLVLRKYIQSKKTEDLKELIICIIFGAIIFLVPFAFFDGSLSAMIGNAFGYRGELIPWGDDDISSLIQMTAHLLGYEEYSNLAGAGTAISLVFMVLISIYAVFYKNAEKWEIICMISAAQILCAGIGHPYVLLYMIIPAWYFINSNPVMSTKNIIFAILLAMVLMPFPGPSAGYQMLSYGKGLIVWAIVIIILVLVVRHFFKKNAAMNDTRTKKIL